MTDQSICPATGCENPVRVGGYCRAHYLRNYRHGDPLGGGTNWGKAARYYREVVLTCERGPDDECLIWPFFKGVDGYARMTNFGKPGMCLVSRRVCEVANGPAPTPKHEAAHSCGRGKSGCVTKGHLSWKTPTANAADKQLHGTVRRGSTAPTAKLHENDVRQIRSRKAAGEFAKDIAADFGVSKSLIGAIATRKLWAHLDD